MKKRRFVIFLGFALLIACIQISSQNKTTDSLYALLKKDKEDTNKVIHLNNLSIEFKAVGKYDTALMLANQAATLSNTLSYKSGIGYSYFNMGLIHGDKSEYEKAINDLSKALKMAEDLGNKKLKGNTLHFLGNMSLTIGNYVAALDYYEKALKIREELGVQAAISSTLGNMGIVYHEQGNYAKALDYYFKALKIDEELKNSAGISRHLQNIGSVYDTQNEFAKELDYYFKALKISDEVGDKHSSATTLGNIGIVYSKLKDNPKALGYYFKALKIDEELGNKPGIARHLGNIGTAYKDEHVYTEALDYFKRALTLKEEIGDRLGTAINLGNVGNLFTEIGEYKKAFEYLYRSLALCDSIGAMNNLEFIYEGLSQLYRRTTVPLSDTVAGKVLSMEGVRLRALYYRERYMAIKDKLFNEENKKELVKKELNFEFEKKEAITQAEHEKQVALKEAESRRQQAIIWLVASIAIAIGIIAIIILRTLNLTSKQKKLIEDQKTQIEISHKKVNDSINYAQKIQYSILPSEEEIKKYFPDYFVYFQPKDIISGDFYWLYHYNGLSYIAVADCTGHGVPGALISMTIHSLLNEVMMEEKLINPAEILNHLHRLVYKTLQQNKGDEYSQDGCDISLCIIDHANKIVHFSGARNHIYFSNGKEITVLKATSKSIGGLSLLGEPEPERIFKSETFKWQKDTLLIMSTDGVFDQLNPQDEVFGTQRFKEIINSLYYKPICEGSTIITSALNNWKQYIPSQDDMLVMGFILKG